MFEEARKTIKKAKKIYVVGHINPDGDSIGAAFGVCMAMKKLGKDAKVILPKRSKTFDFLPYIDDFSMPNVKEDEYDLLICVDSSDKTRLALSEDDFKKAKKVILLDHHQPKDEFADVSYVYSDLPAASEIVYNLIKSMKIKIDDDMATYLYMGIMTDTGSFNYSSTKPSTLKAAADLISTGIDFSEICKKINDTKDEGVLYLIKETVQNMEVYFDGKVRLSYVDYDTIKKTGLDEEDAEGMTNYLRMVRGTEVAVYIRGKSDGTNKVSLRSNGNVDVSKIAIHFGGGGHKRASGYTMPESYDISKKKLIDMIGGML